MGSLGGLDAAEGVAARAAPRWPAACSAQSSSARRLLGLDATLCSRHQGAVPELYLFTWNLNKDRAAHDLTIKHLAQRGARDLFIACVQELPGKSAFAQARTCGLFMSSKAWGATVVLGRLPWLVSGSGASKTTIEFTSWLRFTVK